MSIAAIDAVLQHVHDVGCAEKLVLLVLASFANEKGEAWPSRKTISRLTDIDERRLKRILADLYSSGHLKKLSTGGRTLPTGGSQWSNLYRLTITVEGGHLSPPRGVSLPPTGGARAPQRGVPKPPEPSLEPKTKRVVSLFSRERFARR